MKRRTRIILWIVLAAIILAVASTGPMMLEAYEEKRRMEQSFHGFAQALQEGKLSDAYARCGEEFRNVTSLADFEKMQAILVSRHGSLKATRIEAYELTMRESRSDWLTVLRATLEFERAKRGFHFWLRNVNGQWVVVGDSEDKS